MPRVEIYTRNGCHLCDVAKEVVYPVARAEGIDVVEVDIEADPELEQKFGEQVPVIFVGGRKAFKYRVDDVERLRELIRRALRRT